MQLLWENSGQQLKQDPSLLNEVTDRLLKECTKQHHPHNRLLPASFVQMLLMHVAPQMLVGSNEEATKYILGANCLRNILIANFTQMSENKLFRAIAANYAQTLNLIVQQERESWLAGQGRTLKFAARGYILNEIMLKLLQISHVFVPELLRFAKNTIQIGLEYLKRYNQQSAESVEQKEFRIISKPAAKSKIPKHLFKLTCRKLWKKSSFILFIKSIFDQVKSFLTTCGFSKHALGLEIYKEIVELFEQFKKLLSQSELALFVVQEEAVQPINQEVYLQEPLKVRELTPRFYDEEQSMILSKLRKKKQKLTKKIENDLRKGVIVKQQEAQVREEVRKEKGKRQQKKELLIIEKQTVEVKKYNRQIKKVKQSKKSDKAKNNSRPAFMTNAKARATKK